MQGRLFSSGGRNEGAIDYRLGRNCHFGLLGKVGVAFGNADAKRANLLRSGPIRRIAFRRLTAAVEVDSCLHLCLSESVPMPIWHSLTNRFIGKNPGRFLGISEQHRPQVLADWT